MSLEYRGELGQGPARFSLPRAKVLFFEPKTHAPRPGSDVKLAFVVPALAIGWLSSGLPGACALGAIAACVGHLSHSWAGLAAALVAATSPAFYVGCADESGSHLFAALAVAVSGLAIGAFGPGPRGGRWWATALGMLGLGLGWRAGGALVGVALPAASVTLAWAFTFRDHEGRLAACIVRIAYGACAAALTFAAVGVYGASADPSPLLEAAARSTRHSFDSPIGEIGRAFFPWSALLPLSLAALTELPALSLPMPAGGRERSPSALRVLMLTGTALSYGLSALPTSDARPGAVASLVFGAGAVGLWSWDIARCVRPSSSALVALALLVALLALDFLRLPTARLATFAPRQLVQPSSLAPRRGGS